MDGVPEPILELIVRFTADISDVSLNIDAPRFTTTLSLKQRIREHLPAAYASRRLRLIYAGKALADTEALSSSLNLASLRASNKDRGHSGNEKSKGKQPLRPPTRPPPLKLYIHCSIGDALSQTQLEDEAIAAASAEEALQTPATIQSEPVPESIKVSDDGTIGRSTSAAPRGFDRLLNTGFSAAEVAQLRTQFLANLSYTHTPENMPTGIVLLALEDRWLDNDTNNVGGGDGIGGDEGDAWGADDGSALDDFLWGNVAGFFWPIGALVWGFREEGVWTRRRQIAVFTGLLINLTFGFAILTF